MNKEELMITKEDLVNWLNRLPNNDDLDLIGFITTRLENFYKLQQENKKQKEINQKAIEYIKSKENGKCIHNGIEKGAYTFVLDFDEAREFIWELLQILEDKEV